MDVPWNRRKVVSLNSKAFHSTNLRYLPYFLVSCWAYSKVLQSWHLQVSFHWTLSISSHWQQIKHFQHHLVGAWKLSWEWLGSYWSSCHSSWTIWLYTCWNLWRQYWTLPQPCQLYHSHLEGQVEFQEILLWSIKHMELDFVHICALQISCIEPMELLLGASWWFHIHKVHDWWTYPHCPHQWFYQEFSWKMKSCFDQCCMEYFLHKQVKPNVLVRVLFFPCILSLGSSNCGKELCHFRMTMIFVKSNNFHEANYILWILHEFNGLIFFGQGFIILQVQLVCLGFWKTNASYSLPATSPISLEYTPSYVS